MSHAIANRKADIARATKIEANPLDMVPDAYLPDVIELWSLNQHMLPNALPLCARVKLWVAEENLTADEFHRIALVLRKPERAAQHTYAGQFLADLAVLVAATVKDRENRERNARLLAANRGTEQGGEAVKDLLKESGVFLSVEEE